MGTPIWEAMSYHGHVGDSMGATHGNNVGINRVAFGGGSVWQKDGEYVCVVGLCGALLGWAVCILTRMCRTQHQLTNQATHQVEDNKT